MNGGALNAYTLNGSVIDPVVRTSVVARAYAVPASKPRVLAYLKAALTPSAVLTGAIGRVQVSLAGFATLRAVSDLTPRALRRSVVGSTATATGAVQPRCLLRASVDARAAADGRVDFNIIKRIPWDEPAPEGRVFKVSPETFTFMVT